MSPLQINSYFRLSSLARVMCLPVLALLGITIFGDQTYAFITALEFFLIGFGNCGPDNVIIGAVTMEYGGNQGTQVTSLVNGLGSLGGLIEGPIVAHLVSGDNWSPVILLLLLCSVLPIILFMQIKENHTTKIVKGDLV